MCPRDTGPRRANQRLPRCAPDCFDPRDTGETVAADLVTELRAVLARERETVDDLRSTVARLLTR